jgi:quercetin dioxygenase-like cupin family protein
MPPQIESFKRPDWEPLPFEGCVNVEGRVLFFDDTIGLALLRFGEHGNIHEHPGPNDTVVSCLEGHGDTSVGGEVAEIQSGQRVYWPAEVRHGLWTEDSTMTTLMCERPAAGKHTIYTD